ncbi:MAG: SPOR domain-containing protein [Phycisphaerae bacterium]
MNSCVHITCLLAAIPAMGCADQTTPQARQLLMNSYSASATGDYRAVIAGTDAFLRDSGRGGRADEAYYLRGLARYNLGDTTGAQADLSEALDRTQSRELRGKAAIALGDLACDRDDMPTAEAMYGKAIDNLERGVAPMDHAYYRLGCVLQRQGRWKEADLQFALLAEFFSGSDLAARGGRRMHARDWTIQAGTFDTQLRAEAAAKTLSDKNLPAVVVPVMADSRLIFVVQVGHYSTYEAACAALAGVKACKADAFVITAR